MLLNSNKINFIILCLIYWFKNIYGFYEYCYYFSLSKTFTFFFITYLNLYKFEKLNLRDKLINAWIKEGWMRQNWYVWKIIVLIIYISIKVNNKRKHLLTLLPWIFGLCIADLPPLGSVLLSSSVSMSGITPVTPAIMLGGGRLWYSNVAKGTALASYWQRFGVTPCWVGQKSMNASCRC